MFQLTRYFCKYAKRNIYNKVEIKTKIIKSFKKDTYFEMQQKRRLKKLTVNQSNLSIKIGGSGAHGVPGFVVIISDQVNYLFNCGEGTQRLAHEHHIKMSKIDHIFLTSVMWKNIGGLAGLLLTAQSQGLPSITIHGPESIESLVEAFRDFVNIFDMNIYYSVIDPSKKYKDHIISVEYVPLTKCVKHDVDEDEYESNANDKRVKHDAEAAGSVKKKTKCAPEIICYICEAHPKPGSLIVSKLIEYGVGVGPERELLKRGVSITLRDGTVVHPKDVSQPATPGVTLIVIDCPTKEYLHSLINHSAFSKYQNNSSIEGVESLCVVHFTPEDIFNDEEYQNWMKTFLLPTEHVIINEENTCMGTEAVHKYQYLLNMIHPEIFPLLSKECFKEDKETSNDSIYRARTQQTVQIRPQPSTLIASNIHNKPETYIETYSTPEFNDLLKMVKANIDKVTEEFNLNNIPDYPRIVMLGTGCSAPSKVRNTSGILLRVNKDTSILMDCGEGTLGQIVRFYGIAESDNILRTIKAVYISHIHADHHLGLIDILLRRKKLTDEKVYILAPHTINVWLNVFTERCEPILNYYELVYNQKLLLKSNTTNFEREKSKIFDILDVKEIMTVHVRHCKNAFGVSIILKNGEKIVYSGDTMHSNNLITLGADCDLLIHEATMEDGREQLAKRNCHSTTSQAIQAGKDMNAKFILLTHFSQRYAFFPELPEEKNVGLAYDNMEFKLPQLRLLPLFNPCYKAMCNIYKNIDTDT